MEQSIIYNCYISQCDSVRKRGGRDWAFQGLAGLSKGFPEGKAKGKSRGAVLLFQITKDLLINSYNL